MHVLYMHAHVFVYDTMQKHFRVWIQYQWSTAFLRILLWAKGIKVEIIQEYMYNILNCLCFDIFFLPFGLHCASPVLVYPSPVLVYQLFLWIFHVPR